MANVTISAFKAAFQTLLQGESALDGVTIHLSDETTGDLDRKHIVLGNATAEYDHYAMGGRMLETADLTCSILSRATTAVAALAEAEGILEAVAVALTADPAGWTVAGTVLDADLMGWETDERVWADQGRECEIEFVVQYRQVN